MSDDYSYANGDDQNELSDNPILRDIQLRFRYTAHQYQVEAGRTLIMEPDFDISPDEVMVLWNVTGLAGEVGEVCDTIKKVIFHREDASRLTDDAMRKELGDVCWYLAALCTHLGMDLGDVMMTNIEKLRKRFPNGWDNQLAPRKMDE